MGIVPIHELTDGIPQFVEVPIDKAMDDLLLQGAIDTRVHISEPWYEAGPVYLGVDVSKGGVCAEHAKQLRDRLPGARRTPMVRALSSTRIRDTGMNDTVSTTTVAAGQLNSIIERVERLEEEKKEVADQIKEIYAEAKANGFDAKTIRKVVSLRKKPTEEREEEEALLDLYLSALGMLPG